MWMHKEIYAQVPVHSEVIIVVGSKSWVMGNKNIVALFSIKKNFLRHRYG